MSGGAKPAGQLPCKTGLGFLEFSTFMGPALRHGLWSIAPRQNASPVAEHHQPARILGHPAAIDRLQPMREGESMPQSNLFFQERCEREALIRGVARVFIPSPPAPKAPAHGP